MYRLPMRLAWGVLLLWLVACGPAAPEGPWLRPEVEPLAPGAVRVFPLDDVEPVLRLVGEFEVPTRIRIQLKTVRVGDFAARVTVHDGEGNALVEAEFVPPELSIGPVQVEAGSVYVLVERLMGGADVEVIVVTGDDQSEPEA